MQFSLRTLMAFTALIALAAWTYRLSPIVAAAAGILCLAVNVMNFRDEWPKVPPGGVHVVTGASLLVIGGAMALLGLMFRNLEATGDEIFQAGVVCLVMAGLTFRLGKKTRKKRSSDVAIGADYTDDALCHSTEGVRAGGHDC